MAEILPMLEMLENRWMRAWAGCDAKTLKALTSRKFRMVIGSKPCTILDAASFLDAAQHRFRCNSYRFGDIYARSLGPVAVFATRLEMRAEIDGHDWSGSFWLTDIWVKSRIRRSWRLAERELSRPETSAEIPAAVRSLQRWR